MTSRSSEARMAHFLLLWVTVTVLRFGVADSTLVNASLRKPTAQKDDLHDRAESHQGNDGSPIQSLSNCTHTRTTTNTWWMVDLIHIYDVHTIRILNRDRDSHRLSQFYIYVSKAFPASISPSTLNGEVCLYQEDMIQSLGYQEIHCTQTRRGRFVYIWKETNGVLTVCDFQVMVDLKSRQMDCPIQHGKKVAVTPVYTEILNHISFTNCLLVCAAEPERDPSFLQIDKREGKCQCIQTSDLKPEHSGTVDDVHFDVCQLTETNADNSS